MAKNKGTNSAKMSSVQAAEERAAKVAQDLSFELVEVVLQKESRGKCLCIYIDKEDGITLDDCEHYHKAVQPLLDDIDYDFLEVSSPGIDRPIKTMRDFQKNRGQMVEVKLFAPMDGSKQFQGTLHEMDDETLTILDASEAEVSFSRKAVAIVKPVIDVENEDFSDLEVE
ncbi:MAG: ribosome maturation factor RimP [Clostridiales bacterium]|nr:ribosome maturation factor RimP [Clostridiales bacterium]